MFAKGDCGHAAIVLVDLALWVLPGTALVAQNIVGTWQGRPSASPKSACASPGGWASGMNTSFVSEPRLAHVILDDGVAATKCVLGLKPVKDPLGRMALLFMLGLIVHQDLVDDPQPGTQLRPRHWLFSLVARRRRKLQHFADALPRRLQKPSPIGAAAPD